MTDPVRIPRIVSKIQSIWMARPNANLGSVLETIENQAWDMVPQRYTSARLMHLPDWALESALDLYIKSNRITL